jgi:hypothetical protein
MASRQSEGVGAKKRYTWLRWFLASDLKTDKWFRGAKLEDFSSMDMGEGA